jgi:GntR family transcriptional regulator, transcriptional repressor for pyruvate dehydrogenase complex
MRQHIEAYERYAERKFPHVMEATIPWDQRFFS